MELSEEASHVVCVYRNPQVMALSSLDSAFRHFYSLWILSPETLVIPAASNKNEGYISHTGCFMICTAVPVIAKKLDFFCSDYDK